MKLYKIGRGEDNNVKIENSTVSRRHAELVKSTNGLLFLSDCASTSGTFVWDGQQWCSARQSFIQPNSQLKFGTVEVTASELLA